MFSHWRVCSKTVQLYEANYNSVIITGIAAALGYFCVSLLEKPVKSGLTFDLFDHIHHTQNNTEKRSVLLTNLHAVTSTHSNTKAWTLHRFSHSLCHCCLQYKCSPFTALKKKNPVYSLQTLLFVMVWNLGQHDFAAERCWRRSYFMCVTTVLVWTRQRLQLTEPGGCGGRLRLTNKLIVFWGVRFLFCILRLVRQGRPGLLKGDKHFQSDKKDYVRDIS